MRGFGIAFGVFAASFALHIVGGATDQNWLFGTAVALIYLSATGFAVIAWLAAGACPNDRLLVGAGMAAGFGLTLSALWAADGRSFAGWHVPLGVALVLTTSRRCSTGHGCCGATGGAGAAWAGGRLRAANDCGPWTEALHPGVVVVFRSTRELDGAAPGGQHGPDGKHRTHGE